jgi:hypothetical protein
LPYQGLSTIAYNYNDKNYSTVYLIESSLRHDPIHKSQKYFRILINDMSQVGKS